MEKNFNFGGLIMETYKKPVIASAVEMNGAIPALLAGAAAAASAVGFATAISGDFSPHPEHNVKLSERKKNE